MLGIQLSWWSKIAGYVNEENFERTCQGYAKPLELTIDL